MVSEEIWRQLIMPPSAPLKEALLNLDKSGLQIVLVAGEDDELLGTLTDGDVRRALINDFDLNTQISQVMAAAPRTVSTEASQEEVELILRQNQISHLPILKENGQLAGIHMLDNLRSDEEIDNVMIIMAGGKGVRMMPLTEKYPKPMLEVGGKPIIQHIIERARRNGFRKIFLTVNFKREYIEDYFQDGSQFGVSIKYIYEDQPLGTAGSLSLVADKINLPCVVTNGDIFSNINFRDILDFHQLHEADATMATRVFELQNPFGVVDTDGIDIVNFEEKPVYRSHVNAGIYVLSPRALTSLSRNEPCDMPGLFTRVKAKGQRTIAFPMFENWTDIGNPEQLTSVRKSLEG